MSGAGGGSGRRSAARLSIRIATDVIAIAITSTT